MAQLHPIAVLYPLLVGIGTTIATIAIHVLAVNSIIQWVRHERRLGRAGKRFAYDALIVAVAVLVALTAHLIEMGVWAIVLEACGEFVWGSTAFYHSAMNYTSLGYGDIVMSPRWKLLGPLEAADGLLMFGVSTALVFAVIQRMVLSRYEDLRE
jgi:hypothetical protein